MGALALAKPRNRYLYAALTPYTSVCAILAILMIVQTLNQQWSNDFWVHFGTMKAFARSPIHPMEPFTNVAAGDPFLSPYMLVLGLASRWLSLDPITVLSIVGLLNLGLWLFSLRRLVLALTGNRAAPVWVLLFTLLAWGIDPWRWSGYFDINSIGFGLPYPSMFASAVALLALSSAAEWLVRGRRYDLAIVGTAIPIILLTHQFTALWAAVAGVAIVIGLARRDRGRRVQVLVVVAMAGAAVALLWPYYSLFRLVAVGTSSFTRTRALYELLVPRAFLMVPGIVVLIQRARRNIRDPLVLMFLGASIVFTLGGLTQTWALGRVFPGMILAAHVALGDAVAAFLMDTSTSPSRRRLVGIGVATLLIVGLAGSSPGLVRMVPHGLLPGSLAQDQRLVSIVEPYRQLFGLLENQGRVVASPSLNQVVAGISGDVLVPPVPTFLEDLRRRRDDATQILSPSTEGSYRRLLLETDGIKFLVITPGEAASLRASLGGYVSPVYATRRYVVFRVLDAHIA